MLAHSLKILPPTILYNLGGTVRVLDLPPYIIHMYSKSICFTALIQYPCISYNNISFAAWNNIIHRYVCKCAYHILRVVITHSICISACISTFILSVYHSIRSNIFYIKIIIPPLRDSFSTSQVKRIIESKLFCILGQAHYIQWAVDLFARIKMKIKYLF